MFAVQIWQCNTCGFITQYAEQGCGCIPENWNEGVAVLPNHEDENNERADIKARGNKLAEALEAMMRVVGPIGKVTWADDDQINDAFGISEKSLEAWRATR